MVRLVKFTEKGPYKLEAGGEAYYLCQCGLSKKFPFCDGSHKRTKDEEEGKLYVYDENGRVEIGGSLGKVLLLRSLRFGRCEEELPRGGKEITFGGFVIPSLTAPRRSLL